MTESQGFLENRNHGDCPAERALRGMRGRWKLAIPRELEGDGLVQREVFPEVPPRVEYLFSARGQSLIQVLDSLHAWGVAVPSS